MSTEKLPTTSERKSGVSRIIGVDKETEKNVLDYYADKFKNTGESPFEKEKSQEAREVISIIIEHLRQFIKRYGIEAVNISSDGIHVIDVEKLPSEQQEALAEKDGSYLPERQQIVIFRPYTDKEKIAFSQAVAHELLHLNSFLSFQAVEGEAENGKRGLSLERRRSGFTISSPKREEEFFSDLNEAVIQELTMRFDWEYFLKIPQLAQEYQRRKEIVQEESHRSGESEESLLREIASLKQEDSDGQYRTTISAQPYREGVKKLNSLVSDLYEKNKDQFSSREDVFAMFVEAVFKGHLLPVARIVEKTYGRGSFRKLGEKA